MKSSSHVLIDLYVPATAAEPEEAHASAAAAGLDAIVYVADRADELPDPDAIDALNDGEGPTIHPACQLVGPGFRVTAILPEWNSPSSYEVLESTADLALLQTAVAELGGIAIPVCPRQGPDGGVLREVAAMPKESQVGVVALVASGSPMARDLDIEDASIAGRRILGATGPFAKADEVGRYGTVLPAEADDIGMIISRLGEGYGVAVEFPPPGEGRPRGRGRGGRGGRGGGERGGEGGGDKKRRRRRRNRRGGGGGDRD